MARPCPVCGEEAEDYPSHLSSHSKEDVVALLLRQQEAPAASSESGVQLVTYTRAITAAHTSTSAVLGHPPPATLHIRKTHNNVNIVNNIGTNFGAGSSGGGPGTQVVVGQHTVGLVNPLTMMHMPLSMVSAHTPLLLPQVNGPTLLVNVPNYVQTVAAGHYPPHPSLQGLVMPGLLGQVSLPSLVLSSSPLPTSPPVLLTTTTPPTQPTLVSSSQPVVSLSPTAGRPAFLSPTAGRPASLSPLAGRPAFLSPPAGRPASLSPEPCRDF